MQKAWYKSKTILIAFFAFLFLVLDAAFGWNLTATANENLQNIFVSDPVTGEVVKVNFVALFTLVWAVVMRFITKVPIKVSPEQTLQKKDKILR